LMLSKENSGFVFYNVKSGSSLLKRLHDHAAQEKSSQRELKKMSSNADHANA